jgi:hypothetical protein
METNMTDTAANDPVAAFRDTMKFYVKIAKEKLSKADGFEPVVLLIGSRTHIEVAVEAAAGAGIARLQSILKGLCVDYPDIDHVVYLSLAHTCVVEEGQEPPEPGRIRERPDAKFKLTIHGIHRQYGFQAVHISFVRKEARQFEFADDEWIDPQMIRGDIIQDVFGKRHLNS